MSDAQRIADFLDMLSVERGAARNTLEAYRRDLSDASLAMPDGIGGASHEDVTQWQQSLSREGLASSTIARRMSALRQFYRFELEEGIRSDNPASRVDVPHIQRHVPEVLSREEITLLLEACTGPDPKDFRDLCLLELIYSAGFRASEVCALTVSALPTRHQGFIRVIGKGNKERLCPVGRHANAALDQYLDFRNVFMPGKNQLLAKSFLFPSGGKEGHISRRSLQNIVEERALKAGLDPAKISPHTLRHAFATHMLQGGADLRTVQILLGHADISTTQIYTHLLTDDLADLLAAAHPLSRRKA